MRRYVVQLFYVVVDEKVRTISKKRNIHQKMYFYRKNRIFTICIVCKTPEKLYNKGMQQKNTKFKGEMPMLTGQLEHAFKLAEKHQLDVSTILELNKIIAKEVNGSPKTEEKILQTIIQLLENNKTILKEAT